MSAHEGICFVLIDASARTGKRRERRRETDKVLGAFGRDVLNENGKLLLHFAKENKGTLFNAFFFTSKSIVSHAFQSANRHKVQAQLD